MSTVYGVSFCNRFNLGYKILQYYDWDLMKSMRDAYHDDKPLILGSAGTLNAIDIIQQIAQVDVQRLKAFWEDVWNL